MNSSDLFTGIAGIGFLILGAFALILAVMWIVLPWLLMSKMDKVLKELQESNKHLAYLRQISGNDAELNASIAHNAHKSANALEHMLGYYTPKTESVNEASA
jgi:type II secretory pathway component PulM